MTIVRSSAVLFLLCVASLPAQAQHAHDGHGAATETAIELPPICEARTNEAGSHTMVSAGEARPTDLSPGHQALFDSMGDMHDVMMSAMSAEDIDVAFVCGMIPHHQGAVAMARAVIEHGDDPWTKELAEQVIATQEQEIADMLEWLRARM
ncbi:CopM family metallochaperone [Lutibaculum baratangense]|uniref:Putative exported protein n=1 Tax=Lutibaculum baratangense AMV1 TaxID=631454 RepID=V4RKS0_9HYPH|nr:DUF305 domain-containing protein [Lutibaculum baratangense]ESR23855.1 putative exported protein [Lutibaculum baratangense AMV1]